MHCAMRIAVALVVLCSAQVVGAQEMMAAAGDGLGCPVEQKDWSPEQVWAYRVAAIERGDMNAVACTYAEDVVVIMPGSITKGRAKVMENFIGMSQLLGGAVPTVLTVTSIDNILMITFFMETPFLVIPDGSDTFVFNDRGQIIQQTVHDTVVFKAPPPSP